MDNLALHFDPMIVNTCLGSALLLGAWFTFWRVKGWARTEKETAHVLSLMASFVMTCLSLPMVYRLFQSGFAQVAIHQTWTTQATLFFMTYAAMDLIVGVVMYPKRIGFLTGWVHHLVYIALLSYVIRIGLCSVFVLMCLLEGPTFLLSLGSIRANLRNDFLFASAFLSTRIFFHAFVIYKSWRWVALGAPTLLQIPFFALHCYWFYGFIRQQLRKRSSITDQSHVTKDSSTTSIRYNPLQISEKVTFEQKIVYTSNFQTTAICA
ncbi:hypothetical protein BY458DRAFT_590553 [Sporodiniella umbellata]|nr:hypothetical protein BY458DRAFT_590553 [Sporodiniella umbellata]